MASKVGEQSAFIYMDALRTVAAATVVLTHIRDLVLVDYGQAGSRNPALSMFYFLAGFGHLAVIIFFVLSGFWITGSVVRRASSANFWSTYLIDRLSRLWIVLIPALVIGATLDLIGVHLIGGVFYAGTSGGHSLVKPVDASLSWQVFAANVVFLQTLIAPTFGSNGPLWSLAYEFWYYLWFPALWMLVAARRPTFFLASLALAALFPDLAVGFVCWCCGSALHFALQAATKRGLIGRRSLGVSVLILGCGLFAWVGAVSRIAGGSRWLDIASAASFAVALLGLCVTVPPGARWLKPIAAYGANSSFSLYLIHYPIVLLVVALALPNGRVLPGAGSLALVTAIFFGVVAFAWLFSHLTERRTSAFRRVLRSRFAPEATLDPHREIA